MFLETIRSPATLFALLMAAALLLAGGLGDAGTATDVLGAGRAH